MLLTKWAHAKLTSMQAPRTTHFQLRHYALAAFFILAPAVAVGGALALAVLLCLIGALCLRPSLIREGFENKPLALVLLLALTVWILLSTLWSPLPFDDQVAKITFIVPLGLMFAAAATSDQTARRVILAGGLAATVVLTVLLFIEAASNLMLNRIAQPRLAELELLRNVGRGSTMLIAMAWPAAAGLLALGGGWRAALAAVVLAAVGWIALQFGQSSNVLAFVAGLVGLGLGYAAPRLGVLLVSFGWAAWMLLAPFLTPLLLSNPAVLDAAPMSWAARVGIWNFVSARVLDQPWFGHGLEASRAVTDRVDVRGVDILALPVHPHSASLQIWYETGVVGAVLAAGVLVTGGLWMARRFADNRAAAAGACATMAALGIVANISFGIWAEWWMATLFMVAAMVGALGAGLDQTR